MVNDVLGAEGCGGYVHQSDISLNSLQHSFSCWMLKFSNSKLLLLFV